MGTRALRDALAGAGVTEVGGVAAMVRERDVLVVDPACCAPFDALPPLVEMLRRSLAGGERAVRCATLPVTDTLKWCDDAGRLVGTADRARYRVPVSPLGLPAAVLGSAGADLVAALPADPERWTVDALLRAVHSAGVPIRVLDTLGGPDVAATN